MSEAPAVVLGAGGRLGQECVKRLLTLGRPVRAVVRTPSKYASVLPEDPKLQVVAGDISDPASLRDALQGAKGVIFAASGTTYWSASAVDNEGVGHVAAVAKELDAGPVVLVTSMLVTPKNRWNLIRLILNNIRYSLMDHKYQGEEKLRASGVPYTIVRPGGLANKPAGMTLVTSQGDKVGAAQSISRADVAAVCVEALTNPAANGITLEVVSKLPEAPDYEKQLKDMWSGLRTGVHN